MPSGPLEVNCYIIGCEKTAKAAVVDPGGDADKIMALLGTLGLDLQFVVNTHGHFDHIGANRSLVEATGAQLLIHKADSPLLHQAKAHAAMFGLSTESSTEPARELLDGDVIQLGDLSIRTIHTPGHSPGGICLYVEDCLFVGDTLFAGSIGRTDLPGGDYQQLISSIVDRLMPLPDQTRVFPGHGPATTIGNEKRHNPFLN